MTQYQITADPQPKGEHWASMGGAAEHLERELRFMAAFVDLVRGDGLDDDALDVLDLGDLGPDELEREREDGGHTVLESWWLEVRVARWEGRGTDGEHTHLARVVMVLGTGGPHVEIVVDCDTFGDAERMTLERRWSGVNTATTTDARAMQVVDSFLATVLPC